MSILPTTPTLSFWPPLRYTVSMTLSATHTAQHMGDTYEKRDGRWGHLAKHGRRMVWISTRLSNGRPQPELDAYLDSIAVAAS